MIEVATAVYGVGIVLGLWSLPAETWQQFVAAATVILAGLYKMFTIGNNPMDKAGY